MLGEWLHYTLAGDCGLIAACLTPCPLCCVGGNLRLVMGFKMRCDWIVALVIVYQWVMYYPCFVVPFGLF